MKTVTIVGLGALGSHLVLLSRNWDVRLNLIDFDRVDSKNIQSQFHTEMAKGNKAQSLTNTMMGLFKRRCYAYPVKLDQGNVEELLDNMDLVIDCTDNLKARKLIQKSCKGARPCLHGCLSADGTLARIVWTEHFNPDPEGEEGQATCEDGENLGFHAAVAARLEYTARLFLKLKVKQSWQLTPTSLVRIA